MLSGLVAALMLIGVPVARAQVPMVPKGSILIDADTGAVIDGLNIHTALPPASTTKLLTALAAVEVLKPGTNIPVSARTASTPAFNLNMKEGQVWKLEDVMAALLLSSANDAAMALAEKVSGTAENFSVALRGVANKLGMVDDPLLQDPAGFDDNYSIGGGNKISPYDLAIAARAALAEPRIASLVGSRTYSFDGADGVAHRLLNHNKLLSRYDGAVGMKTGYTKRSLHSLVAAATRDGRTMIAVILNAPGDTYGIAATMLDKGFATPVSAEPAAGRLPLVPVRTLAAQPAPASTPATPAAATPDTKLASTQVVTAPGATGNSWVGAVAAFLFKLLLGLAAAVAILRIRVKVKVKEPAPRSVRVAKPPKPKPKPRPVHVEPIVRKTQLPAPRPARPVTAERSRPTPKRPLRHTPSPVPQHSRRRRPVVEIEPEAITEEVPAIDPKLALRFEILARTGQVVR